MKNKIKLLATIALTIVMILSCTKSENNNPSGMNGSDSQGAKVLISPQSSTIYEGQPVSFSVTVQGKNVQYQWQKDGNDIPNTNSDIYAIIASDTSMSGSYRCIIWNDWGSDTSQTATLKVNLKIFIVTYYGNGSTGGTVPSQQAKMQGVPLTISGNTGNLVKTGYMFSGWNTSLDGKGLDCAIGASYTADVNLQLYAKWIILPTYTITYDGNGNTGGNVPLPQTKAQGVPLILSSNTGNLVKKGYIFSGWNTTSNGNGLDYIIGVSYTTDSNVKLYAKWTIDSTICMPSDGKAVELTTAIAGKTFKVGDTVKIEYKVDAAQLKRTHMTVISISADNGISWSDIPSNGTSVSESQGQYQCFSYKWIIGKENETVDYGAVNDKCILRIYEYSNSSNQVVFLQDKFTIKQ